MIVNDIQLDNGSNIAKKQSSIIVRERQICGTLMAHSGAKNGKKQELAIISNILI